MLLLFSKIVKILRTKKIEIFFREWIHHLKIEIFPLSLKILLDTKFENTRVRILLEFEMFYMLRLINRLFNLFN